MMFLISKITRNDENNIFQVVRGQENGQPFANLLAAKKAARKWLNEEIQESKENDEFVREWLGGFETLSFYESEYHNYEILEISNIFNPCKD